MSEYDDPYRDSNGVLLNKLGITDEDLLLELEAEITAARIADITTGAVSIQTRGFGLARLQEIHKFVFEPIYAWAGVLREAASAKDIAGTEFVGVFTAPSKIREEWKNIEVQASKFASAEGLSLDDKLDALTDIFIAANNTHPFVEGNGRTLQLFMTQLAQEQGVLLDFSKIRNDAAMKSAWNYASAISGVYGILSEDQSGSENWKLSQTFPPDTQGIRLFFKHIATEVQPTPKPVLTSEEQNVALWTALKSCNLTAINSALKAGANPNAVEQGNANDTSTSQQPLLWTCEHLGSTVFGEDIAMMLLEGGANIAVADKQGRTPLVHAAANGWHQAAKALLERGANPNSIAHGEGETALHAAAASGDPCVTALLLEHGADPRVKNNWGQTPLDIATKGRERIVEVVTTLSAAMSAQRDMGCAS